MSTSGPDQGTRPDKRELFERLLKQRGIRRPDGAGGIPGRQEFSPCPSSFGQERLWFLHQLDPDSAVYHIPAAFMLEGEVDEAALERALNRLAERHEVLRTTFDLRDGRPLQFIASAPSLRLAINDLSAALPADRRRRALSLARAEAVRPFDLQRGPLVRALVVRLGPRERLLALTLHHIVCDGWSLGLFISELGALYAAARSGAPDSLPALPVQYADYALWQRRRLESGALDAELSYWRERLAGARAPLALPTDRPRTAERTHAGAAVRRRLGAELSERVASLARSRGATVFAVLLAAWQALLWRYTGSESVVVGAPAAGRPRAELEGLVGFFVNTVALAANVRAGTSFAELLAGASRAVAGALEHQEVPFERVVEEVAPERDLSHSPLFQVMLTMRSDERQPLLLEGVTATPVSIEHTTAKFDWLLYAFPAGGGLELALEYSTELFERETAERVLGHYEQLLKSAVGDPEQRLSELPILTESERRQLIVEWNNTEAAFPSQLCLHELFEEQAAAKPDAVALRFEGEGLSYRELNERANRLAHYLVERGVQVEDRVGLLLERSVEMVVSLLAVLKAGAMYVPLDPQSPAERLRTMIEDGACRLVLTQQSTRGRLPEGAADELCLESERARIGGQSGANLSKKLDPANAAYMIYTSGSTGRPKGVVNTHLGICNRLHWMQQAYQLTADDLVLQKTPFTFDVSVWEFFWPLMIGARLVVAKPEGHRDNEYLIDLIVREGITTLHFVPSMLRLFLDERGVERCASLRRVVCSGEALAYEVQERFFKRLGAELHNLYGPTEAAIDVTSWKCEPSPDRRSVPIGRPIANTQVYVLDARFEPVPVGVAGELYLSGVGLARGYWGRPDLTAESFVPDPFGGAGRRMYRTGDIGRRLPGGELEFLGRDDGQVKLRGHRIELGEIEAALRGHERVRDVVVVLREEAGRGQLLAAYVAARGGGWAGAGRELREYLRGRLPEYMVPGALVLLEELPLSPNGKVDRKALPAPSESVAPEAEYREPVTALEQSIAAIWREVLGREKVGLEDNFFDLGGHSLLLVQVRGKLSETLGRDLPVLELFKYPTVSTLAARMSEQSESDAVSRSNPAGQLMAQARQRALVRRRSEAAAGREVAVIGIAGRFPGARSLEEFWQNLRLGVESVSRFSEDEARAAGVSERLLSDERYVRAGSVLDDVELFDAEFFGLMPREAEIMDPQQRLFLECAWEAVEDAGYDPQAYRWPVGVFAGLSMNTYLVRLYPHRALLSVLNGMQTQMGNDKDFVSTRASYKLGFTGPSLTVQTACSTSLVAVHMACQSLLNGECSMALAGGASVRFPQRAGYLYQEGGIRSPDGHCRPFDASAAGTVSGSGVGVVLLKPLAAALRDRDHIYAVIKGSAVNNDGALKVGYTAPSVAGQAAVIAEAQAVAGVTPETISYVEAHGTGTPLGDPIEVAALTQAFGRPNGRGQFCALGSLKSNIGHLDAAAGVAGLIKTVLALKHAEIPPSLHYERPNPEIDFEHSPFFINARLQPWERVGTQPLRAGVSSFGIGGTNAHAIVEEAPAASEAEDAPGAGWQFLVLSARSEEALDAARERLATHLESHPKQPLSDVAYTLQTGRRAFAQRAAVACRDASEAAAGLRQRPGALSARGQQLQPCEGVVFLFPGQGAQQVNMGRALYEAGGEFRRVMQECSAAARRTLGYDLRDILYPPAGQEEEARQALSETAVTQVALFAVEYALARQLGEWGIVPQAMLGHSLGEYVAACVSGAFSPVAAVELVAERGRLMQQLPRGVMLAANVAEPELRAALAAVDAGGGRLWVSALNAPERHVAGGTPEAVAELEQYLAARQVRTQRLQTSHAFHTGMVEPTLEHYRAALEQVEFGAESRVRYVSNTTGRWADTAARDPDYWLRHMREPVRFASGVQTIASEGSWVWLEVGPGRGLGRLVKQQLGASQGSHEAASPRHEVAHTLGDGGARELEGLLQNVSRLWCHGVGVDWGRLREWSARQAGVEPRGPRRVSLPTYPFQRQRFWLDVPEGAGDVRESKPLPTERLGSDQWFYMPSWKRTMPRPPLDGASLSRRGLCWLVFADETGLASQFAAELERHGQTVVSVRTELTFARLGASTYQLDPRRREDYLRLIDEMAAEGRMPQRVAHFWCVSDDADAPLSADSFERSQWRGFFSLISLAQALSARTLTEDVEICVVSSDMQPVTGEEALRPEKATLIGPCRVISQEFPRLTCRSIDVTAPADASGRERLSRQLLAELSGDDGERVVAYRRGRRWVPTYEPVRLGDLNPPTKIRPGGVYLITGGLGGVGLSLAEHLSGVARANFVFAGRSAFPDEASWEDWLREHDADDPTSLRIRKLQSIRANGSEVLICRADVADESAMREVLGLAERRFGHIHGVVHAAGVAGSTMIQRRPQELFSEVLRPKTAGTLVLERLFKDRPLDFMALCSSTAALLGGVGGVDYCAGNAFLDAFAQYASSRGRAEVVSVNWDAWSDTGMAAAAARTRWLQKLGGVSPRQETSGHPLIEKCLVDTPSEQVYETLLSVKSHWVLDEHRIRGRAVVPGTAYLEMARAALARRAPGAQLRLRQVTFISPLQVGDAEERALRVMLRKNADGYDFTAMSRPATHNGAETPWEQHAVGTLDSTEPEALRSLDIEAIKRRCEKRELGSLRGGHTSQRSYGPRWQTVREVFFGTDEGLAALELPAEYAAELDALSLHPALLDFATSFLASRYAEGGGFVPFNYQQLRLHAPLTRRLYSYAKLAGGPDARGKQLAFELHITDEDGNELLAVERFTMKRVAEQSARPAPEAPAAAERNGHAGATDAAAQPEPFGLRPREAAESFERIISSANVPQVVVSTRDIAALDRHYRGLKAAGALKALDAERLERSAHPRPDLATAYAPPRNETEQTLVNIWQSVLGIDGVGIDDDFFELGGDSLVALQLMGRLHEAFDREPPLPRFFESPTVAGLALLIVQQQAETTDPALLTQILQELEVGGGPATE
jgi:amino acid adenylation domain-containing protein